MTRISDVRDQAIEFIKETFAPVADPAHEQPALTHTGTFYSDAKERYPKMVKDIFDSMTPKFEHKSAAYLAGSSAAIYVIGGTVAALSLAGLFTSPEPISKPGLLLTASAGFFIAGVGAVGFACSDLWDKHLSSQEINSD